MVGLGECRGDGLEREVGACKAQGAVDGSWDFVCSRVIGGFEAPVVRGSDDLHSNDI